MTLDGRTPAKKAFRPWHTEKVSYNDIDNDKDNDSDKDKIGTGTKKMTKTKTFIKHRETKLQWSSHNEHAWYVSSSSSGCCSFIFLVSEIFSLSQKWIIWKTTFTFTVWVFLEWMQSFLRLCNSWYNLWLIISSDC